MMSATTSLVSTPALRLSSSASAWVGDAGPAVPVAALPINPSVDVVTRYPGVDSTFGLARNRSPAPSTAVTQLPAPLFNINRAIR